MTDQLSLEGRRIIDDEIGLASRVAKRVAQSLAQQSEEKKPITRQKFDVELLALREQIAEARGEDAAALLAQMMRTAGVAAVDLPKAQGSVDPQAPYFGHLRLEEGGKKRDVLIGKRGMIDREAGVVIVDWRNAPVSKIYYRYDEGDDYEEELGDQVREGQVLARRTLSFHQGRLLRIRCPAGTFVHKRGSHGETEEWVALAAREAPELRGGVGKAERAPAAADRQRRLGLGDEHLRGDKHLPEITALIDAKQFDAMTQARSGVVILQGGAGSGKTTVALHRVAWLCFENKDAFQPAQILVVVAQRQLVRYIERVLPSLDVHGVRVTSWLDWAKSAVQRILGKHGRRLVDEPPQEVSRFKKHPSLFSSIDAQVGRRLRAFEAALMAAVSGRPGSDELLAAWNRTPGPPLLRLKAFVEGALIDRGVAEDTRERARRAAEPIIAAMQDLLTEWEELISDENLLGAADLDPASLESALRYMKRQVEEPPDESDIDEDARTPIDETGPDPDDPIQALDSADLALLLNMQIARCGALLDTAGNAIAHAHVVVDEAQDLSAMEIKPLLVATGERHSLTLAGDVVQKVVFDNGYESWEELEQQLGIDALNVEPLKLSYRSTSEVVAFAREVLGPLAPKDPPRAVRSGAPVEVFSFVDAGEEVAFLGDSLRALMAREPLANCAVLFRYPERARFFFERLLEAEVPRMRLVLPGDSGVADDEFTFTPGIDVTTVAKVKGLEYDYVILVEVTEPMYPNHVAARHLLHIGATRAAHQLWVTTSTENPSPLLPEALLKDSQL